MPRTARKKSESGIYQKTNKPPPCLLSLCLILILMTSCTSDKVAAKCEPVWAIPPYYQNGYAFSNGVAAVKLDDGTWSFINKSNTLEFDGKYLKVNMNSHFSPGFKHGVAIVVDDKSEKYLYRNGRLLDIPVIKPELKWASESSILLAKSNDQFGFINTQYLWYINPEFMHAYNFTNGYAVVSSDPFRWIVDTQGNMTQVNYDYHIEDISEGYASVNKCKYINLEGAVVIEGPFEDTGEFHEGLAAVKINGKYGYIDKNGKLTILADYMSAENFSEGLASVTLGNGNAAFINSSGNIILELPEANAAEEFHLGTVVARAHKNQKLGIVDKKGQWLIAPNYTEIYWTKDNYYVISNGAEIGAFFPESSCKIDVKYRSINIISGNRAILEKNNEYLLFDTIQGKQIGTSSYQEFMGYSEGLLCVRAKNGKYGYIDLDGNWILAPQFSYASIFKEGLAAVDLDGKQVI